MTDVKTFLLPDVGEGLTEAEILSWHVKPGDAVVVNQTIVEIETAKAAVELPCPYAGVVAEVFVAEGDLWRVSTAGGAASGRFTPSIRRSIMCVVAFPSPDGEITCTQVATRPRTASDGVPDITFSNDVPSNSKKPSAFAPVESNTHERISPASRSAWITSRASIPLGSSVALPGFGMIFVLPTMQ